MRRMTVKYMEMLKMQEEFITAKVTHGADRKKFIIFMIISIVLAVAIIGVSVFSAVINHGLRNEIELLQSELSAQNALSAEQQGLLNDNKAALEMSLADIAENKAEMEKYRKLISTLESANAEQKELIESLTTPLNGRDEKTPEPTEGKIAYLTFDDGPCEHTEEILKILTEKEAVATFFVKNNDKYMDKLTPILEQGSALAMHSLTHDYKKIYSSVDAYFEDLYAIEKIIYEKTGVKPKIMRMPGGSSNQISKQYSKGVVTKIAERLTAEGYIRFDWNVDSRDASNDKDRSAAALLNNIKKTVKDQRVINILMHDTNDKKTTVEALPQIIDYLREQGYSFMTLNMTSTPIQHAIAN